MFFSLGPIYLHDPFLLHDLFELVGYLNEVRNALGEHVDLALDLLFGEVEAQVQLVDQVGHEHEAHAAQVVVRDCVVHQALEAHLLLLFEDLAL